MIVTIDGPAGAGKSTVARRLAAQLGYVFLDTGAMYRAVTYAALQAKIVMEDAAARLALVRGTAIEPKGAAVNVNGEDVSEPIRTAEVTASIHHMADDPAVRELLVLRQREWAVGRNVVTEGRDQGTVVFPDAECKIFLTASAGERARRRQAEREIAGETVSIDEIRAAQDLRDERDRSRTVGPLQKAADAIEVVTDGMTIDDVIASLEALVQKK